jgi:hypothetical protein
MSSVASTPWHTRWQQFSAACVRGFHAYATWLVGISWKRFVLLSVVLMIVMGIVHDMPPLTWRYTETVVDEPQRGARAAKPSREPVVKIEKPRPGEGVDISIDDNGVRITPRSKSAAASAPAASAASAASAQAGERERLAEEARQIADEAARQAQTAAAAASEAASAVASTLPGLKIEIPPDADSELVRETVRDAVREAVREARRAADEAVREAKSARREALAEAQAAIDEAIGPRGPRQVTRKVGIGDGLMELTFAFILVSAAIKATYKGRVQAEAKAALAEEVAEAESLKRQVVEARMAAMQAQVEPHFLFNTLASIDHLIETDPKRASQMQKNLIALLRASMPTMREANAQGTRDLGRELTVIRPYLEILKVRMEDRLHTEISVPEGLLSAEFPPMMLQSLVENAIKHGLEPKAEGGMLSVRAEIVHGKLAVTVADTGLGFGRAPTAGTGTGLANIRERLQLLYGAKAQLKVAENQPTGTIVTITVPYQARHHEEGARA